MYGIDRPASDFPQIVRQLGYRKRTVRVQPTSRVTFSDLNWSGGTKSEYHAMCLDGQTIRTARMDRNPPWANPYEGVTIDLPVGHIVVRTGYFCGKPSTMTIYVHPDNMPALLPAT